MRCLRRFQCRIPDKIADRIAGAIVDLAYTKEENPRIAVEVLIGHGDCHIIAETNVHLLKSEIEPIVERIAGQMRVDLKVVKQDIHLSENQAKTIRCGDNGIFKGVPTQIEEEYLTAIAKSIYREYPTDGKYIIDAMNPNINKKIIVCQSNATEEQLRKIKGLEQATINPLGYWEGGTNVDTGATNRKLGSDMGRCVTGGGLHGKDLSKADVTLNIYAFVKAQETKQIVEISCAIGDEFVDGYPYSKLVEKAREYIRAIGGFEKFAEWGLIR